MMNKTLRITVDGKSYEVTVEVEDEAPKKGTPPSAFAGSAPQSATPPPTQNVSAPSPSSQGAALDVIVSPLAGRVVAIGVKVGQQVKGGEHVLTLEAMKMNTFVFAQKEGKVKEIRAAVGEAVQENQPLIILE